MYLIRMSRRHPKVWFLERRFRSHSCFHLLPLYIVDIQGTSHSYCCVMFVDVIGHIVCVALQKNVVCLQEVLAAVHNCYIPWHLLIIIIKIYCCTCSALCLLSKHIGFFFSLKWLSLINIASLHHLKYRTCFPLYTVENYQFRYKWLIIDMIILYQFICSYDCMINLCRTKWTQIATTWGWSLSILYPLYKFTRMWKHCFMTIEVSTCWQN